MSTVAPRPPAPPPPPQQPLSPALVDSEGYIDEHIRRTRRSLKLVDLAAGVLTLVMGLLAFLLVAGLIDHWVIPGGLGVSGRMTMFGILLLGLSWYGWRQFVPLLRSINPVYAAHTIEQSSPSLKNSLLNVLLFRTHRQDMSARVYHALEQQAAQRLSAAPVDASIDHAALLRLGYALIAVIAACALYSVLSPKNLATSAARVLAPWTDLAAPSRVHITDVKPGDASVALGERVNISAEILGAAEDDPVRLRYTTADESMVDESITMTRATGAVRFAADLPRATDAARALGATGAAGVQQDLEYWIEAGDARSPRFKLGVFQRPTIVVQRVRYQYPDYTREPPATVDNIGDIRGLEGTVVTIEALANQPIKSASIDFDADGSSDQRMTVDGQRATASFTLELRDDRRTPWHLTYALRFTTTEGRANDDPVQHRLDVTPDYAPEVSITQPEEPEQSAHAGDTVLINVEARDPDYALNLVRLVGRVGDREVLLSDLLTGREHSGPYKHLHPFVPADAQLKAGDVLEYWAEAADNRAPEPNVGLSDRRRLTIVADDAPANPQQQNNQGQGGGAGEQGDGNSEGGAEGENGASGAEGGEPGENGEESESGEGGQQQGQGTAGGSGESGESQDSEATGGEPQAGGEGGESSEQNAESAGGGGQSGGEQSQDGESQAGESAAAGGSPDENPGDSADANDSASQGADGQPGGQPSEASQGAPQERVSNAGDQDADVFERIARHMPPEEGDGGESSESTGTEGEAADSASQPNEGEAASAAGSATENPAGGEESSTGEQTPEGDSASEGATESESESPTESETPAGDQPEQAGAPEAGNKAPREQSDGGDESESGAEAEAPTGDSHGDTESDARGDQSGDRSGEGNPGGGQQAENSGQGEAGSHEPSDTGANQSSDAGPGETGTEAGNEELADGETGQSSGDQPGAGSESGDAAGESASADGSATDGDQPSGDRGAEAGDSGSNPGDQSAQSGNPAGEQGSDAGDSSSNPGAGGAAPGSPAQTPEANNPAGDAGQQPGEQSTSSPPASSQPPSAGDAPQSGEGSDESSSDNPSQNASSPPTGGGTNGGGVDGPHEPTPEPGGDDPNLDYARRQTDLVLNRLDEQLAKHKVDPALLKSLGWTEDELRQFVERWKALKAAADAPGDQSADAREELDAALRSLGLRPRGPLQVRGAATPDELRDLNEAYRARAPVEYADRVRAYIRGAAEE